MRTGLLMAVVVVACVVPSMGRADEDAGAPKTSDAEYCRKTRTPRVESVQISTRRWFKRLDAMRAACTVRWVKTGAVTVQGSRVAPEMRGDVQCPKGPPAGETKESVWAALSLFLEQAPLTDEVMEVGEVGAGIDAANVRCVAIDAEDGITLRPPVNDTAALRRILAWKPKP
jgi:hypothetical protein